MNKIRSYCTGPNDYTVERQIISEMSFERLNWQYHHNLCLIKEYAESLSNASICSFSGQLYYQPIWIRTAAREVRFILDEIEYRMDRDFTPYLESTLKEVLQ